MSCRPLRPLPSQIPYVAPLLRRCKGEKCGPALPDGCTEWCIPRGDENGKCGGCIGQEQLEDYEKAMKAKKEMDGPFMVYEESSEIERVALCIDPSITEIPSRALSTALTATLNLHSLQRA